MTNIMSCCDFWYEPKDASCVLAFMWCCVVYFLVQTDWYLICAFLVLFLYLFICFLRLCVCVRMCIVV